MESEAQPNPHAYPIVPEAAPPPEAVAAPSAGRPTASLAFRQANEPESVPRPSVLFLVIVTALSLAADLGTKWWATMTLASPDVKLRGIRKLTLVADHIDFIFAQNPGGAWSFLRSMPDTLRRPFFLIVSSAATVFIVTVYLRLHPDQRAMKWGLPLALGGALGNLADRIRYGWVVDFVDIYVVRGTREHHWPTFNVADIAIVVGVGLMAISMLSSHRPKGAEVLKSEPASAPVPPAG